MLLEIKIATDNDIWGHFLPFTTLTTQKDKILKKKNKKAPGDIILLKIRTINRDHMMYGF